MRFFSTRGPRRPSRAYASIFGLGALSAVLLSGCGGGGGINGTSVSDQGFRIVPAGGAVAPPISGSDTTLSGITFTTQSNVVDTGVQVSVSKIDLSSVDTANPTNLSTQVGNALTEAFQITLSPNLAKFNNAVTITLNLRPTDLTGLSTDQQRTIKIYTLDQSALNQSGKSAPKWFALPGTFTASSNTASSNTVTGTLVFPSTASDFNSSLQNSLSDSGVYVVAYDAAPGPPTTSL